jgi:hypothetical protein
MAVLKTAHKSIITVFNAIILISAPSAFARALIAGNWKTIIIGSSDGLKVVPNDRKWVAEYCRALREPYNRRIPLGSSHLILTILRNHCSKTNTDLSEKTTLEKFSYIPTELALSMARAILAPAVRLYTAHQHTLKQAHLLTPGLLAFF